VGRLAIPDISAIVVLYLHYAEYLALGHKLARIGHIGAIGINLHAGRGRGFLHEITRIGSHRLVDNGHWYLTDYLRIIYKGVHHGVSQRQSHEEQQYAGIVHYQA
jgi:hypothetical protein